MNRLPLIRLDDAARRALPILRRCSLWGIDMSTALVATLRESIGYLQDDGYHQTARLMAVAADEIERLNRRVHALESGLRPTDSLYGTTLTGNFSADRVDPRRHHGR